MGNERVFPPRGGWCNRLTGGNVPRMRIGLVALVSLAVVPRLVLAEGPAFDCAKAQGEVEQLICRDEGLAALDRQLDGVYKAAQAKARDEVPKTLVAEQRGWVKGRNDCWKTKTGGPEFLTASWQATEMRECVEGQVQDPHLRAPGGVASRPREGPRLLRVREEPRQRGGREFLRDRSAGGPIERRDQAVTAWHGTSRRRARRSTRARTSRSDQGAGGHGHLARRAAEVRVEVTRGPAGASGLALGRQPSVHVRHRARTGAV